MNQSNQRTAIELGRGWRRTTPRVSLAEVHRSVVVPVTASFWRKLLAFSGPGFLVAVGYLGPGDWGNDPAGRPPIRCLLLVRVMNVSFTARCRWPTGIHLV